mmetsp:Transcript_13819/g.33763  ORF Transcript_13819/g.33763 Transcript_13819/m.33763 type:complete len:164 (+) Transcript_13819:1-492(+)
MKYGSSAFYLSRVRTPNPLQSGAGMLPYFIIYPVWLVVAVVYPAAVTVHYLLEVQKGKGKNEATAAAVKQWVFYWFLFAATSTAYTFVGWALDIVFGVLSVFVGDIQGEVILLLSVALVNPWKPMLQTAFTKANDGLGPLEKAIEGYRAKAGEAIQQALKKAQ